MSQTAAYTSLLDQTLKRLIGPHDVSDFREHVWGKQTCWVTRNNSVFFADLFSYDDLDRLIGYSSTNEEMFFLEKGQKTPAAKVIGSERRTLPAFYDRFTQGLGVMITQMEHRWPTIAKLASDMGSHLGFGVRIDLVCGPAGADLGVLTTNRSCFVLQISGESRWTSEQGEWMPAAGDTLYLPRHVTARVGIDHGYGLFLIAYVNEKSYRDLMMETIRSTARAKVSMRGSLPFGSIFRESERKDVAGKCLDVLRTVSPEMDLESAITELSFKHKESLHPMPSGHLEQIREVDGITLDTLLERRPGSIGEMRVISGKTEFQFPGYFQVWPEKMFLAMDFLKLTAPFRPRDIEGWYTDKEKLILVKGLVKKGFLRIAANTDHPDA